AIAIPCPRSSRNLRFTFAPPYFSASRSVRMWLLNGSISHTGTTMTNTAMSFRRIRLNLSSLENKMCRCHYGGCVDNPVQRDATNMSPRDRVAEDDVVRNVERAEVREERQKPFGRRDLSPRIFGCANEVPGDEDHRR